jgi:NADH-quinone oxidoreductase subunit L
MAMTTTTTSRTKAPVMLIPLGVLALGAIFSGMIWYNASSATDAKVRDLVRHGSRAAAAAPRPDGEAARRRTAPTEATGGPPRPTTRPRLPRPNMPRPDATERPACATEGHGGHDPRQAVGRHAAPKGAIFMAPDNHRDPRGARRAGMGQGFALHRHADRFRAGLAVLYQDPEPAGRLAAQQRPLYLFLLNKWYFDELYDVIFVRPARGWATSCGRRATAMSSTGRSTAWRMGIIPFFTRLAGRAQSGYLFHYAFAMVLGIVLLVTWMTLSGGAH